MAHFREQDDTWTFRVQSLLDDARVLISRYQARSHPERGLTPEQRKAWAAEIVVVLGLLGKEMKQLMSREASIGDRHRRRDWLSAFADGRRPVKPLPQDQADLRPSSQRKR